MGQKRTFLMVLLFATTLIIPFPVMATGIRVSWNANTDTDLAGYNVYYGTSSGKYSVCINVGNVTSYKIDNLAQGTTYYFIVTALDNAGNESADSEEVSATIPTSVVDTAPVVDTTPPTGSIIINNNASYTRNRAVTLTLSASDDSGSVVAMKFSNNGTTWSDESAYAAKQAWALSRGYGVKKVYAKFKDASGNWSSTVSDKITYGW
jgi:fibronectin type 3 domain-containing protein